MFAQHTFPSATANGQLGSFTMSVVNNQTGPWAMKGMELNQRVSDMNENVHYRLSRFGGKQGSDRNLPDD